MPKITITRRPAIPRKASPMRVVISEISTGQKRFIFNWLLNNDLARVEMLFSDENSSRYEITALIYDAGVYFKLRDLLIPR